MKQLTIEHLLPHLKKGAKAILSDQCKFNLDEEYPNPLNNQIGTIESLSIDFETGEYSGVLRITDKYSVDFENGDIILCLLPLNYLTKEIEHNGEKFVPIIELSNFAHKNFYGYKADKIFTIVKQETFETDDSWACVQQTSCSNRNSMFFRQTDKFKWFEFMVNGDLLRIDELALFQKLFEWHFDVFRLIPDNLAIDINNLYKIDIYYKDEN